MLRRPPRSTLFPYAKLFGSIDIVSDACEEKKSDSDSEKPSPLLFSDTHPVPVNDVKQERKNTLLAGQIIRQRRSAVAMDGVTIITKAQFYEMLSRVVPVKGLFLWDLHRAQFFRGPPPAESAFHKRGASRRVAT